MPRHLVVVLSNPVEGREQEFHDWYEHTHLDEVLASTGWAAAQRFSYGVGAGPSCDHTHMAIYEADAPDAAAVLQRLGETRSQRQQSDAIDMKHAACWIFTAAGDRHVHPGHP